MEINFLYFGLAIMVASTLGLIRMYGSKKMGVTYIRTGVLCMVLLTICEISFSYLVPYWPNLAFFASCLGVGACFIYVIWTIQLVVRILRGEEPS